MAEQHSQHGSRYHFEPKAEPHQDRSNPLNVMTKAAINAAAPPVSQPESCNNVLFEGETLVGNVQDIQASSLHLDDHFDSPGLCGPPNTFDDLQAPGLEEKFAKHDSFGCVSPPESCDGHDEYHDTLDRHPKKDAIEAVSGPI